MNSVVRPTESRRREYLPAAERRERVVGAAIELISREGLSAASTRAVAAEAGVSVSTLHYCFGSKEALVDAVLEAIVAQIGEVAGAAVRTDHGLAAAIEASVLA